MDADVSLPERVAALRQDYYDNKIPSWYHGYLHVAFTATFCLISITASLYYLEDFKLYYLAVIALSFSFTSLKEYSIHRYPLHRKTKNIEIAFYEHAGQHHGYFTHDGMEWQSHKDFIRIFFQPQDILLFIGILNVPLAIALGYLFHFDIGILHYLTGVIYFSLYETLHYIYHSPATRIWHRIPILNSMIQHHKIHHNRRLMGKYNFGVVLPFMDRLFNSKYVSSQP